MSGNSSLSIAQTVPIVSSRRRDAWAISTAPVFAACVIRSTVEEREAVFADLELVAVLEPRGLHPLAIDERAVEAALILDEQAAVARDEDGMPARDGDIVEEDAAVGGAADRRAFAFGVERLP